MSGSSSVVSAAPSVVSAFCSSSLALYLADRNSKTESMLEHDDHSCCEWPAT